mmetsp:Transcript_16073/g.28883  ORF Transcript_16073/g.28883 Transcript_16073/m.28883 type:complete len:348 (+) Transcript_16073:116-1159(+)|eukprot:CAMPEP_0197528150 /NCGR_PEP_ID=MMETSP1318-20131121/24067_1 /TAXON_ID=552666 /ORGANISM="Partenskyella glossopodia, Strain RCC365" /LENGTH=347 /DNA_ID=CAMNT_0043083121 /DNA_START=17 /DNA_END=1060 /DNA_ORIENTATION=-
MAFVGYVVAILSAVFNGSFPVPFKLEQVAKCQLHPLLFQLYVSFGVFLSSWLALAFLPYNGSLTGADSANTPDFPFPPLALVAGGLFVLSIVFSFAAIPMIGLAMSQGIWGGSAILVAFIWGVAAFGNPVVNPGLAVAAIVLLLCGVGGIAFCESIATYVFHRPYTAFNDEGREALTDGVDADDHKKDSLEKHKQKRRWLTGICCAVAVGLAGGSTLVPLNYVPKNLSGFAFLPAFGCGAMITSPLICIAWFGYYGFVPEFHLKETLWAGVLSGTLWNISNACALISIPALTYAIAYPILQCALFVAGLWGVFAFKEIKGYAVVVFFASGVVLICGAIALALSAIEL